MRTALLSWTLLFACNLMWSLQFTCIKLTQEQVGPYFTVWGPMILSVIFLAPFALKDFSSTGKSLKDIRIFFVLALIGAFPAQVLVTWGTQLSTASNAAIITLTLPVITALFAYLLLKERMNWIRWLSFAIAIAGVALVSIRDLKNLDFTDKYALGNIIIFMAILGNSFYNTGSKKIIDRYTPVEMVFFTYVFLIILLTPLVIYYEKDVFARIHRFTFQTWTGLALLALFHNFLSMILFFKALKKLEAIQVALSNYLIAFFGLIIAWLWLGENLQNPAIAGGILIFSSTLIITVLDYRMEKKKSVAEMQRIKKLS